MALRLVGALIAGILREIRKSVKDGMSAYGDALMAWSERAYLPVLGSAVSAAKAGEVNGSAKSASPSRNRSESESSLFHKDESSISADSTV